MSIYTPKIEDTFAFISEDGTEPHWLVVITPDGHPDEAPQLVEVTYPSMVTRIYRLDEDQTEKVRLRIKVKLREHADETLPA